MNLGIKIHAINILYFSYGSGLFVYATVLKSKQSGVKFGAASP